MSLRVKHDEAKKRQHKALMEKAHELSDRLQAKTKALHKEEGQWRWKRHKQCQELEVEKQALDAKKAELSLKGKKMDRKKLALMEGCETLTRKAVALGSVSARLEAEKQVPCMTHSNLTFYSLAFPLFMLHLSLRGIFRPS